MLSGRSLRLSRSCCALYLLRAGKDALKASQLRGEGAGVRGEGPLPVHCAIRSSRLATRKEHTGGTRLHEAECTHAAVLTTGRTTVAAVATGVASAAAVAATSLALALTAGLVPHADYGLVGGIKRSHAGGGAERGIQHSSVTNRRAHQAATTVLGRMLTEKVKALGTRHLAGAQHAVVRQLHRGEGVGTTIHIATVVAASLATSLATTCLTILTHNHFSDRRFYFFFLVRRNGTDLDEARSEPHGV